MSLGQCTLRFITPIVSFLVLAGCTNQPGETRTFADIEFQWCPSGTFVMGSPEDEEDRREDETQHVVTLTHGFWLGKYEVTQAQWEAVMGDNPSGWSGADLPVESVTWDEIQAFIDTLNASNPDMQFRLPTEAEWEYACRAGTTTRFYWGEDPNASDIDNYAWYTGNSEGSARKTHPVGEKSPNDWGLYDMSGNVWEQCIDFEGDYPSEPVTDPVGPSEDPLGGESFRVIRGGSLFYSPEWCRSARRMFNFAESTRREDGFRLLRTP